MHFLVRQMLFMVSVAITGTAALADEPGTQPAAADSPASEQFFTQRILPLLKERCYKCHSHDANSAKGGLVLDSRAGWKTGGDSGTAIVPGNADESLLIQAVRYSNLKCLRQANPASEMRCWNAGSQPLRRPAPE
jgi:hypothetical protein